MPFIATFVDYLLFVIIVVISVIIRDHWDLIKSYVVFGNKSVLYSVYYFKNVVSRNVRYL